MIQENYNLVSVIIELGCLLITIVIAVFAHKIAKWQSNVQNDSNNIALFEQRYRIFDLYEKYLIAFSKNLDLDIRESLEFINNTDIGKSRFLFGNEIYIHFTEVLKNSLEHNRLLKRYREVRSGLDKENLSTLEINQMNDIVKWMVSQTDTLTNLFIPYMKLDIRK